MDTCGIANSLSFVIHVEMIRRHEVVFPLLVGSFVRFNDVKIRDYGHGNVHSISLPLPHAHAHTRNRTHIHEHSHTLIN